MSRRKRPEPVDLDPNRYDLPGVEATRGGPQVYYPGGRVEDWDGQPPPPPGATKYHLGDLCWGWIGGSGALLWPTRKWRLVDPDRSIHQRVDIDDATDDDPPRRRRRR